ncbi:MAG: putative metal-binding motif-containing protein, partial [Myxococcota bacterium]|nr:putative metal-binding motif-containing protein [Myxococcota bacterium]
NAAIHHGADEVCNGLDDNCNSATDEENALGCLAYYMDGDGDGFGTNDQMKCLCQPAGNLSATKGDDCNDAAQNANPTAPEMCDGIDNDCDGILDESGAMGCVNYYADADNDGYGAEGTTACLCGPSASHTTKIGGDCDDGDALIYLGANELCDGVDNDCDGTVDNDVTSIDWFEDADGDGFGDPDSST